MTADFASRMNGPLWLCTLCGVRSSHNYWFLSFCCKTCTRQIWNMVGSHTMGSVWLWLRDIMAHILWFCVEYTRDGKVGCGTDSSCTWLNRSSSCSLCWTVWSRISPRWQSHGIIMWQPLIVGQWVLMTSIRIFAFILPSYFSATLYIEVGRHLSLRLASTFAIEL